MMTTELVLLLTIYVFVFFGIFVDSDNGVQGTFKKSAPRLAAHIERDITVGREFKDSNGNSVPIWTKQD